MDIVMMNIENSDIYIFPIVPFDIDISHTSKNEEFETINSGSINLMGDEGLRTLSISSFFPTSDYSWIKSGSSSDGWSYVDFIKEKRKNKAPVRIVITSSSGDEIVNMKCSIDDFSYGLKRNEDIRYSLSLKEYV